MSRLELTQKTRARAGEHRCFPKKFDRGNDDDVEAELRASLRTDAPQLDQVEARPLRSRLVAQGGSNTPRRVISPAKHRALNVADEAERPPIPLRATTLEG